MKLEHDKYFEILRFSDSRYEKITLEIQYKGEPVAQINQDKGLDNLEIEIFANPEDSILRVPLAGFLESIDLAKKSITG